jgi:hypothetical protein
MAVFGVSYAVTVPANSSTFTNRQNRFPLSSNCVLTGVTALAQSPSQPPVWGAIKLYPQVVNDIATVLATGTVRAPGTSIEEGAVAWTGSIKCGLSPRIGVEFSNGTATDIGMTLGAIGELHDK